MFVGAASDKLQSCLQVIPCVLVHGSLLLNVSVLPQGGGGGGGGKGQYKYSGLLLLLFFSPI